MIRIHKQTLELPFGHHIGIYLPIGSEIIKVAVRETVPTIWYQFEHQDTADREGKLTNHLEFEEREFVVHGTGHSFGEDDNLNYNHIGTCLSPSGRLVYHIYEVL